MSLVSATRYVASLDRVKVDELVADGVRLVLLDRDNTCIPGGAREAPPEVLSWLARVRSAGIRTCLVSNNTHARSVEASARSLGCDAVAAAFKPAPFAVWAALAKEGVPAEQAVLIGDQLFTDMLAGNLAGVRTILVRSQAGSELFYTRLFRLGERVLLRNQHFEGE